MSIYFDSMEWMGENDLDQLLPDRSRYDKMTFGGGRKRWLHMKDDSHSDPATPMTMEGEDVRRLAQQAIAALAEHGPGRSDGLDRRLAQLCDAFVASGEDPRHDMLTRLRQDGVPINDIIDHILPAIARIMGERWSADEISFADVTIGSARLQEAVRAFGGHDKTRQRMDSDAPVILLVIPRPEHHTLGAFVLADQLRRLGYRVDIAIDSYPREIVEMLRKRRYVMVGITAAGRRTLASARELVDTIRLTVPRLTPIIIGGSILDKGLDVLAMTGADHTARDAASALRKSGLLQLGLDTPAFTMTGHAGAQMDRR